MVREELAEVIEDLQGWWDSLADGTKELILSLLAALPGGDELTKLDIEPAAVGWVEADLIGRLLLAIQDSSDVRTVLKALNIPFEDEDSDK